MSNLDAAEAALINFAPPGYILGQLSSLLRHVQAHLKPTDPRRQEFERIAQQLGVTVSDHAILPNDPMQRTQVYQQVNEERERIATITSAANSEALREQVRLQVFHHLLIAATLGMTLIAICVAAMGFLNPTLITLCFVPEESGQAVMVCPTRQSAAFSVSGQLSNPPPGDIDDITLETVTPLDLLLVELVGLFGAAIAAATAIRNLRGTSEAYRLRASLALLKLPTGAITAVLGILVIRGQVVPGLTTLNTSAQILAWALLFGYAQQLFTRLVDQQGQTVLDSVGRADKDASQS